MKFSDSYSILSFSNLMWLDNNEPSKRFLFKCMLHEDQFKNRRGNSFKTGAYFKEQLLKKTFLSIFFFFLMFLFYKGFCIFSTNFKDIWNISDSKNKKLQTQFFATLHRNLLKSKNNWKNFSSTKSSVLGEKINKFHAYFTQLHKMSKLWCRNNLRFWVYFFIE